MSPDLVSQAFRLATTGLAKPFTWPGSGRLMRDARPLGAAQLPPDGGITGPAAPPDAAAVAGPGLAVR